MTDTLPPLPSHPQHGWAWTLAEERAICAYAAAAVAMACEPLRAGLFQMQEAAKNMTLEADRLKDELRGLLSELEAMKAEVLELDRLRAEVEALRADAARLESGCIMMQSRGEFGEVINVMHVGVDLRAAIDEARQLA